MIYQKLLAGTDPYFVNVTPGNFFKEHCHPEIELSFCLSGSYNIFIEKKERIMHKGDLAIINPMVPHEFGDCVSNDCTMLTIEIGPAFLGEHFDPFILMNRKNNIFSQKDMLQDKERNKLFTLLYETAYLFRSSNPFDKVALKGNIYHICSKLLNIFADKEQSEVEFKSISDVKKIGSAINLIYDRYNEELTLDEVCAYCGYSKSNFCKIFKMITGESFHTLLNRHRVDVACLRLKETDVSIEEIALSVGFSDTKSFCRVFKKHTGITAGEYKKSR